MIYKIILGISFAFLMLSSCGEPQAIFESSQPVFIKPRKKFPWRFRGTYVDSSMQDTVFITEQSLIKSIHHTMVAQLNEIDSSHFDKDAFIENTTIEYLTKDVIRFHFQKRDTVFTISEFNLLKRFKGSLFLSHMVNVNNWTVKQLSLSKGILQVGKISGPQDIELLKNTIQATDSTKVFAPDKSQFKRFLKNNGFGHDVTYFKIK